MELTSFVTPASVPIPGRDDFVLVPALCAARPGYALRTVSLHLSRAAGCQTVAVYAPVNCGGTRDTGMGLESGSP